MALKRDVPVVGATIKSDERVGAYAFVLHSTEWWHRVRASFEAPDQDDEREPDPEIVIASDGIMIALAGRMAELVILGRENEERHYAHDMSAVLELAGRYCGFDEQQDEERRLFIDWLSVRTKRLVTAWSGAIERVATELLSKETLSAAEIGAATFPRRTVAGVASKYAPATPPRSRR